MSEPTEQDAPQTSEQPLADQSVEQLVATAREERVSRPGAAKLLGKSPPRPGRAVTEPERRRDGTPADIAGMRIHYRHAGDPDGAERTVDYMYRMRGITVAEGIAVKRKTPSDVSVSRLRMVADALGYGAHSVVQDDPEALQALIWLVRNIRNREAVQLVDLDDLDVLSVWADMVDSDGTALDFPPDLDADAAQQAAELAAAMAPYVPRLPQAEVFGNAAALVALNWDAPDPDAPEETPGEESAGSAPSEQPAASE